MSTNDNNANSQGAIVIYKGKKPKAAKRPPPQPKKKKKKGPNVTVTTKGRRALDAGRYYNTRYLHEYDSTIDGKVARRLMSEDCCGNLMSCDGMFVTPRHFYLGALMNPRDFEGIRLPDAWSREETATYQSKFTINIQGASGTAIGGTNIGRFCVVLNPTISDTTGFSTASPGWTVAVMDGPTTGAWPGVFNAGYGQFFGDPNQTTMVGAVNGLMYKVRPVSASMLVSYNGQILNGGGNIAIHTVPGMTWTHNLANATGGAKSYTQWENLAVVKKAYDGPLFKGAYAVWLPDDETDYLLRTPLAAQPDSTKVHDYPLLVCSGQITPPSGYDAVTAPPLGVSLRVDIYVNYEYTTTSRVVEAHHGQKNNSFRDSAIAVMATQELSMENDKHETWMRVILGGIAGFATGGPVGAAVGAALGAGVGVAGLLKR